MIRTDEARKRYVQKRDGHKDKDENKKERDGKSEETHESCPIVQK